MLTWAATNSLLMSAPQVHLENRQKTQSLIVSPLLRRPPTDFTALYMVLCQAQGISAFVIGPDH
jgi:hypothetical protein